MEILYDYNVIPECAMALGNFDGVHLAHISIINSCINYAKTNNLKSGVLLFENHTGDLCGNSVKLLTTLAEKKSILEKCGLDFVLVKKFDKSLQQMEYTDFFEYLLKNNVKALFVGYDYRFGHNRNGNTKLLKGLCDKSKVYLDILEPVACNGTPVKSSLIREFLINGNIKEANAFLSRPYSIIGKVVHGKKNGTKMGTPTANIECDTIKLIPADGVYSGYVQYNDKKYKALINIGNNPTFKAKKRTIEIFLDGFSKDIYGKNIKAEFCNRIRDEIKFNSADELIAQIELDKKTLENI